MANPHPQYNSLRPLTPLRATDIPSNRRLPALEARPPRPAPQQPTLSDSPDRSYKKKRDNAPNACEACRKRRGKCSGDRPTCEACQGKSECVYDVEPGQTRFAAMKTKVREFELVFTTLRESPRAQASKTFDQIRRPDFVMSKLVEELKRQKEEAGNPSSGIASDLNQVSQLPRSGTLRELSPPVLVEPAKNDPLNTETDISFGIQLPAHVHLSAILPSVVHLEMGINSWWTCHGKMFHTFSHDEIDAIVLYIKQRGYQRVTPSQLCIACIIGALGLQYSDRESPEGAADKFYFVAKYSKDYLIANEPIAAMKVMALLGMFIVIKNADVAITYLDGAICLANRQDLLLQKKPQQMTQMQWIDCCKALRTMALLRGRICATLGYLPEDLRWTSDMLDGFAQDNDTHPLAIIQTAFANIALIKNKILQTMASFHPLSPSVMEQMRLDLIQWTRKLPEGLQFDNLFDPQYDAEDGICYAMALVHLLYLGTFIMLHHLVLKDYFASEHKRTTRDAAMAAAEKMLGVARKSAQLSVAMMANHGVFKRCWTLQYQCYISSCLLMYSTVQKALIDHIPPTSQLDWQYAEETLSVLRFCAQSDDDAAGLLRYGEKYYDELSKFNTAEALYDHSSQARSRHASGQKGPLSRPPRYNESSGSSQSPPESSRYYLIDSPDSSSPERLRVVRNDLLKLILRPFMLGPNLDSRRVSDHLMRTNFQAFADSSSGTVSGASRASSATLEPGPELAPINTGSRTGRVDLQWHGNDPWNDRAGANRKERPEVALEDIRNMQGARFLGDPPSGRTTTYPPAAAPMFRRESPGSREAEERATRDEDTRPKREKWSDEMDTD